ncbi:glucose 1-dehydrogenase [Sphingobium boeckii]|uniref:NAD(P)-dependent dehydrogenase (Short-subunit alcohol dehydrogenase family) n=1 Tax=Sphingobium boeckii TaxID=1082345 RepID=A0A7W9EG21_9SPHN|nr:NAD(P)-dependent dehydrogenase (short-subunit alcohol dehydrogenase family) [Sphingobium boeckii]
MIGPLGAFADRVVIVTGGAGGLGRAIVRAFAAAGARVVIGDMDAAAAADLAAEIGADARAMPLDVADEAQWIALLDRVEALWGGVDILVNNAGFFQPNVPFEDMPLDLWRKHFAINADGVFLGCKHGIRRMKPRGGGAIVNMGSGMSIKATPTASAYCGSKAAVLMTTRTAAAAAAPYNIRVNAVLPGAVDTDMLRGNMLAGDSPESFLDRMTGFSPMGYLASPEDIARGVLFLADPANRAITGVHLPIDGGNMPGG